MNMNIFVLANDQVWPYFIAEKTAAKILISIMSVLDSDDWDKAFQKYLVAIKEKNITPGTYITEFFCLSKFYFCFYVSKLTKPFICELWRER